MSTSMMGATPNVNKLKGSGYDLINIPADPRKSQLWDQIQQAIGPGLKGGGDFLSRLAGGGDEEMWNQLEAPAFSQFRELRGNTASQFSGAGSGTRRSSSFRNFMGGAEANLAERLQSNRLGLQNQAVQQLFSMGQNLLGTPLSQTGFLPRQKPAWQELLASIAPALTQGATSFGGTAGLLKLFPQLMSGG
jgi:hypothetical protein